MLHRSFKPAKCKIALKLAVSRIKLLKNKREAQVKQLKRELAQLLESGQDQTARIRVEHVVREEKTVAAYELIEIYCELIAVRLPMIESQKNCPIDLKEAISSVIFASPRCSDIPELMDVRKHFTAKYGKEFISAAVELRPECGVNRLLVEKLSAKAPDGPTKMKLLTAIAEEHNVKWEPKSFGENDVKSSQDSLVGANTYEKATYVEPPQVHVLPVHDEKGPPNVHDSSQYKEMHNMSANLSENASFAVKKVGSSKSTSGRSNPEIRSSGTGNQEMDSTDSYSENRRDFPMGRQNWNMQFKDAASAAQAAAESAERASMAARAAAELSNREKITRKNSSGSHSSSGSGFRDEVPQEYAFHDDEHLPTERAGMAARAAAEVSNSEKLTRQYSTGSQSYSRSDEIPQECGAFHDEKHISTGSVNSTFRSSSSEMHNEQINTREQDKEVGAPDEYYRNSHENVLKHFPSTSLKSSSDFGDDDPFGNGSKMANIYPHNNSFEQENSDFLREVSMKKQASRTEVDFVSQLHGNMNTENNDHFGDGRMNRQFSKGSSSHFITSSDDHIDVLELNGPKTGNKAVGHPFVTDEGNTRNSTEINSYNDTAVIFDDSESEDDNNKFVVDKTYEEQGSGSFFSSPGSKSQIDSLPNRNAWSPGQVTDEKEGSSSLQSHFSEVFESSKKSAVSSGTENLLPVTFDDSDGPSSDSEEDLVKSKISGSYGHENSVPDQSSNHGAALRSSSRSDENVYNDIKSWLSPSSSRNDKNVYNDVNSSAASDTAEEHFKRKIDITTVPEKDFGYDDLPTSKPPSKGRSSVLGLNINTKDPASQLSDTFNDTETVEKSHIENDKELSYGTLTGGLRNKGYRPPPYLKSSAGKVSSSLGDISVQNEQTLPTSRTSKSYSARAQDTYVSKVSRGNKSLGLREHDTSSDSQSYDLVLNSQETMSSTQDPRTQKEESEANKKSSSRASITYFNSDSSYSEDKIPKQNSVTLAHPVSGFSQRATASSKSGAGLSPKDAPLSEASVNAGAGRWKSSRDSYESENLKKASSRMKTSDNLASTEHGSVKQAAFRPILESNRSSQDEVTKSSARVQPSSPFPKTVIPDSVEASGSSNSDGNSRSEEKASHVHPKLPDYDSFAAHFLSLKKGPQ